MGQSFSGKLYFPAFLRNIIIIIKVSTAHTCMRLALTSASVCVCVEGAVVAMGKCVPKACLIEDFPCDEMYNITTNNMFLCSCDYDDDDDDDYEYVMPAAINQS